MLAMHDYQAEFAKPKFEMKRPKYCLKCGTSMVMTYRKETSDGMCGVYYLDYLCSNDKCRLYKEHKVETYDHLDI